MLRLSREADYGIVLVTRLARAGRTNPMSASDLAVDVRISHQMASKILKRLAREELLISHRGVNGGYRLARPALEITVADVIAAIEGPIGLTKCIDQGACAWESTCDVRGNWQLINRRVLQSLATITIAEMAGSLDAEPAHAGAETAPLVRRSIPATLTGHEPAEGRTR